MRTIQRYLTFMAVNYIVAEVLKSIIRGKPEMHMKYVDFLNEQVSHEIDRFKRLHPVKEAKDEPTDR